MKKINSKLLKVVASLLTLLFGFSSNVIAQYGVPQNYYKLKGNICDFENTKPIAGIKVSIKNTEYTIDEAVTDKLGNFEINTFYWAFDKILSLQAKDNSSENYLPKDTNFMLQYQDFSITEPRGSWEYDKTCRYVVNLKLKKELPILDSMPALTDSPKYKHEISTLKDTIIINEDAALTSNENITQDSLAIKSSVNTEQYPPKDINYIEVYPNPTNTIIHIIMDSKINEKASLALYDNNSNKVLGKSIELYVGLNPFEMDMQHYPAGDYLLIITQQDRRSIKKIIKL